MCMCVCVWEGGGGIADRARLHHLVLLNGCPTSLSSRPLTMVALRCRPLKLCSSCHMHQARLMGSYSAHCMAGVGDNLCSGFNFELVRCQPPCFDLRPPS